MQKIHNFILIPGYLNHKMSNKEYRVSKLSKVIGYSASADLRRRIGDQVSVISSLGSLAFQGSLTVRD